MAESFSRLWRMLATGLCFFTFGLGGVLLGVLVFPAMRLLMRQPARRAVAARRVIQAAFRGFVGMMRGLGVLSYEVHGRERLQRQGLLILANHPSLIDVVFLMALVDNADCIVKAALARHPATWGPVTAAGFVFNDSGAGLLEGCQASLDAGSNLIIFPEGTRTPRTGGLLLQRGAANVAVRCGRDITPVRITVQPATLGKGEPWYQVPTRKPHFVFRVESDIAVAPFQHQAASEALAARHLTDHLTDYFSMETRHVSA
ncbi:lysophospholipid acyltransferase family protein [Ideonella paludis]|uniref:1-acyl-sn-glycerol-3-phosphate acyltransferase n=1 Tax=Ideonella paludis TaxID=1233411 RepID=A0ABS5DS67_9BURK|nr:lysophospholipid acyltransferase family protein [Ideonella paludis]MBQ0933980.1 1-acyl-sn-glycerol-3-phosphate acyltransferase [Ideonella paludis]